MCFHNLCVLVAGQNPMFRQIPASSTVMGEQSEFSTSLPRHGPHSLSVVNLAGGATKLEPLQVTNTSRSSERPFTPIKPRSRTILAPIGSQKPADVSALDQQLPAPLPFLTPAGTDSLRGSKKLRLLSALPRKSANSLELTPADSLGTSAHSGGDSKPAKKPNLKQEPRYLRRGSLRSKDLPHTQLASMHLEAV